MPAEIHPTAIIASGAEIGDNVSIGPYCCIGDNVRIGNDTVLHQSVIIDGYTDIGEGNEIFPHAVLGKAPQHTRYKGEASTLTIGHNNLIREHVTMHPGTEVGGMVTRIGSNGMFMAGSHIAHDCVVEDHVIFSNYVQVGGHVHIGKHCYLGALVGVHPFVRIGLISSHLAELMVMPVMLMASISSGLSAMGLAKPALRRFAALIRTCSKLREVLRNV